MIPPMSYVMIVSPATNIKHSISIALDRFKLTEKNRYKYNCSYLTMEVQTYAMKLSREIEIKYLISLFRAILDPTRSAASRWDQSSNTCYHLQRPPAVYQDDVDGQITEVIFPLISIFRDFYRNKRTQISSIRVKLPKNHPFSLFSA